VAGHFLPHELERIARGTHVLAAARNRVTVFRRLIFHGTFVKNRSDVAVTLKNTDWRGSNRARLSTRADLRCEDRHGCESQRRQPNSFLPVHEEALHSQIE